MPSPSDKKSARRRIAAPTLAMLPRVGDSLSFLYADVVRIVQDDTGVCAETTTVDNETTRVYIPTSALSCVLLGPGTSITQPALATFARHGTTVVCVGSGGVRCYSSTVPPALTTRWLEHQVHHWSDPVRRLDVARRMYTMRFKVPVPAATTLQQLRGLEGQRMKALYKLLAQTHRIGRFRRNYAPDAWDSQDPVNLALSSANTCLYGIVHAALTALGCSPALGYVHQGTQLAFVYDVADLYKAELTVPLAFSLHERPDPEAAARRAFRKQLRLYKLLPRIVADVQNLLAPDEAEPLPDGHSVRMVNLWDPRAGSVAAGVNYASDISAPLTADEKQLPDLPDPDVVSGEQDLDPL
ncbi:MULTISPECIES: type I-E CRISPR-associated endonuclease Cas1e [Streptomyces]|uniref:type I-E CRISPR-associated endonuclease Cas1e n=1 Tax=Streptomyces TaxID=1883 RepID=UPI00093EF60B|nr:MULTISPECIES: type I-E CRISPR-associated endonuclease Cas1e [unclassified Streptomyces]OKJ10727.1 CRISPR-associated protein Cas1 [Streptomyces sp. TSRI0261]QNQ34273.1 type I-E CRISPR-associated endonuclease Cas1 [Streptomyces sp. CB00271]